jgi:hypothetical protein
MLFEGKRIWVVSYVNNKWTAQERTVHGTISGAAILQTTHLCHMCFASLSHANAMWDQNVNYTSISESYVNNSRVSETWIALFQELADGTFKLYTSFASLSYSIVILDQDMKDSSVSARYVNNRRMKIEWYNYRNFCRRHIFVICVSRVHAARFFGQDVNKSVVSARYA